MYVSSVIFSAPVKTQRVSPGTGRKSAILAPLVGRKPSLGKNRLRFWRKMNSLGADGVYVSSVIFSAPVKTQRVSPGTGRKSAILAPLVGRKPSLGKNRLRFWRKMNSQPGRRPENPEIFRQPAFSHQKTKFFNELNDPSGRFLYHFSSRPGPRFTCPGFRPCGALKCCPRAPTA